MAKHLFWLEIMKHQGHAPYHAQSNNYQVFRNVKDFGAKGDSKTDDTAAINAAISHGNRSGGGAPARSKSSTISPALVYFPPGIYRVKKSIVPFYMTQLVGDPSNPPTLLADKNFSGLAVIDVNPYIPNGNGSQWYDNTNTFFRAVRNLVIDVTRVPSQKKEGTCIHWQVSQATSLTNVSFKMSCEAGTAHQGIFMENGSGGVMSKYAIWAGNQQFTVRDVSISNAQSGVYCGWNWGWTFQGVHFNDCKVCQEDSNAILDIFSEIFSKIGFEIADGGSVAAEAILDCSATNTPVFLQAPPILAGSIGSIVLHNIHLDGVQTAVGIMDTSVGYRSVLPGSGGPGTKLVIKNWTRGHCFTGTSTTFERAFEHGRSMNPGLTLPDALLDSHGRVFSRNRPQYPDVLPEDVASARISGAKGDGQSDDTKALQDLLSQNAGRKIVFLDAGVYVITSTLLIPAGTRLVGEAWATIAAKGEYFNDQSNPRVAVQVGEAGEAGCAEISDIVFTTIGPAAGAIVIEWNMKHREGHSGETGMWDSHIRLGGAAGSHMQADRFSRNHSREKNMADGSTAFIGLHLTASATAFLDGTWVWLADHDLDTNGDPQLNIYAGRGILSSSQGPVWMSGTGSEHFSLFQYSLTNAKNHFLGLIQTESPYYQPEPPAPTPFREETAYHDPDFPSETQEKMAWGLSIMSSENIFIFGAGLYSFFHAYKQVDPVSNRICQSRIIDVDSKSSVHIISLSTVGVRSQICVNKEPVVKQSLNTNGFVSTVTHWSNNSSMLA